MEMGNMFFMYIYSLQYITQDMVLHNVGCVIKFQLYLNSVSTGKGHKKGNLPFLRF